MLCASFFVMTVTVKLANEHLYNAVRSERVW